MIIAENGLKYIYTEPDMSISNLDGFLSTINKKEVRDYAISYLLLQFDKLSILNFFNSVQ
mgnify:CR=1 FL=1